MIHCVNSFTNKKKRDFIFYEIFIDFVLNCFNILFSFQYQIKISHENICSLKVKVQNLFNRPKQTILRFSANYYIKVCYIFYNMCVILKNIATGNFLRYDTILKSQTDKHIRYSLYLKY